MLCRWHVSTNGPSVGSYLAAAWILTVFNQQRANYVPDSSLGVSEGSTLSLLGSEMIKGRLSFMKTGDVMPTEDRQFTHSTVGARIVEHIFVGEVLRKLWRPGLTDVEILRPEFDAHG
jgi:hypothetical protein